MCQCYDVKINEMRKDKKVRSPLKVPKLPCFIVLKRHLLIKSKVSNKLEGCISEA